MVKDGAIVSLFIFRPSPRFHKVYFREGGYWEQFGGLFGRSDRDQPFWRYRRFSNRVNEELARVKGVRG